MPRSFNKKPTGERLAADQLARRSRAVLVAHSAFGTVPEALAFLNSPHGELGGRPLDLALKDQAGLARVESWLANNAPAGTAP